MRIPSDDVKAASSEEADERAVGEATISWVPLTAKADWLGYMDGLQLDVPSLSKNDGMAGSAILQRKSSHRFHVQVCIPIMV